MATEIDVKVEILSGWSAERLQGTIKQYINSGWTIQNSHVQWYNGTVEGIYVFIKGVDNGQSTVS